MQSIDILLETAREFLHQIAAFLPRLLLAMLSRRMRLSFLRALRC